jgi:tetratricopeptide (TPR) repeat protein
MEGVVAAHGSTRQKSNLYHALVMLDNRQSRFRPSAETVEYSAKSLALARETGDRQLIDFKIFGRGFTLLWSGDLEAAEERFRAALEQAERTGNVPLQDRCLAYLSIACRLNGDEQQAHICTEQGLKAAIVEQNPAYIGVAKANLAWLSYRHGHLDEVLHDGSAALEQWRPLAYPLEWLARWPLLAVALDQERIPDAIDQARAMLEPVQQRLPDALTATLEEAITAWEGGQAAPAREHLAEAVRLAQEMGYL